MSATAELRRRLDADDAAGTGWTPTHTIADEAISLAEALGARVKRLRDVLGWSESQCLGRCRGALADALAQDARLEDEL